MTTKLLLLPTILFCYTSITFSQTTYVPDDNFEQALINLGYDSGPLDDYVTTANISTITSLDVHGENISDLTGIQDFTSLTFLDCAVNELSSLDITQNTLLTSLNCQRNKLTSLDVSNNTNLSSLRCFQNRLSALDVSKNIDLDLLNCSLNGITSLDISRSTRLTYLDCSGNQLTRLDVSQNLDLKYIFCGYNQRITSFDVTKNLKLFQLSIPNNYLANLDVTQNIALSILYCPWNNFTNLDISNNAALTNFSCSRNELTSLDVTKNKALQQLSCSYNQITELDLTQNTALVALYSPNNQLTKLDVRNGNNGIMDCEGFNSTENPNLTCIYVDNASATTLDCWTKDSSTSFANNETACQGLGTEIFKQLVTTIYPNPTFNSISISLTTSNTTYQLFHTNGQLLDKGVLNKGMNTIDMASFSPGVYFMQFEVRGFARGTQKIIKR